MMRSPVWPDFAFEAGAHAACCSRHNLTRRQPTGLTRPPCDVPRNATHPLAPTRMFKSKALSVDPAAVFECLARSVMPCRGCGFTRHHACGCLLASCTAAKVIQ